MTSIRQATLGLVMLAGVMVSTPTDAAPTTPTNPVIPIIPVISTNAAVQPPVISQVIKETSYVSVAWNLGTHDAINVYRNNSYVTTVHQPATFYLDSAGRVGDRYYLVAVKGGRFSTRSEAVIVSASDTRPPVISADRSDAKVLVLGDSISAGWKRPSYRQPLLDTLSQADCAVEMVGDQTRNGVAYFRSPQEPGYNFSGFTPSDGYDIDHQSFPGISAAQFLQSSSVVSSAATYVEQTQPDYILVHLGSNDLTAPIKNANLPTTNSVALRATANGIADSVFAVIDSALDVHDRRNAVRVLVANVIPYDSDSLTDTQRTRARTLSALLADGIEREVRERADRSIVLVDVESGFDTGTMTFDGLHPNNRGEAHIARAFVRALDSAGLCPDERLPSRFPPLPEAEPTLVSPVPGSTLSGSAHRFEWALSGADAQQWYLRVGSSRGASDYFDSGRITNRGVRTLTVTGLPTNGETVWVEFSNRRSNGSWNIQNFTVTASDSGLVDPAPVPEPAPVPGPAPVGTPVMVSPAPGSSLTSSVELFVWALNGADAQQWYLRVGSSRGASDYFDSGRITNRGVRTLTVTGLPTNGETVWVEFSNRRSNGSWNIQNFTVTASR